MTDFENDIHYAYYSEYSIKSLVTFILNGELKLPAYQRYFVWSTEQSFKLVRSIMEGYFIPPVIIVSTEHNHEKIPSGTYIIDGQQRLTSILLFYLNIWPKSNYIHLVQKEFEQDENQEIEAMEWTISFLQNEFKNFKEASLSAFIDSLVTGGKYQRLSEIKSLRSPIKENIEKFVKYLSTDSGKKKYESKTLGYSFIKSLASKEKEVQMFSHLFKDINSSGTPLTAQETSEALFYIKPELQFLFKPKFWTTVKFGNYELDFPRFCSYVDEMYRRYTNYGKHINQIPSTDTIAKYYHNKQRDYINNYIVRVIETHKDFDYLKNLDNFTLLFDNVFADSKRFKRIDIFEIYVFGLIFWSLFDAKPCNQDKLTKVLLKLDNYTKDLANIGGPLTGIRKRLLISVTEYKEVFSNE